MNPQPHRRPSPSPIAVPAPTPPPPSPPTQTSIRRSPFPPRRLPAVSPAHAWHRTLALCGLGLALLPVPCSATGATLGPTTPYPRPELVASDGTASANLGWAVSVSGRFAALGAPGARSGQGTVYLYARSNPSGIQTWELVRQLAPTDVGPGARFGASVSLSGDTLAVGAPDSDADGNNAGAVHVFERNLGGADQWGPLCRVRSSDLSAGDRFGFAVSLDLNLLAVGAYGEKPGGAAKGAAYVFHRNAGPDWFGQVARLLASDGGAGDEFGIAIALHGDRVLVGAPMDDNDNGFGAGAAYLFARDHGGLNQWGQARKFLGETEQDHFGRAVALRGSYALIGAPDSDAGGSQGRAYLYERNQGGPDAWGWLDNLIGSSTPGGRFGSAVALDPPRALVGAPLERVDSVIGGAVFLFERDESGWSRWGQSARLLASNPRGNDYFGAALALHGDEAVIGAHGTDPKGSGSGSVHPFYWRGHRWTYEQKLTPTHPDFPRAGDLFGSAIALHDDTLAIGAPRPGLGDTDGYGGTSTASGHPSVSLFRRHQPGGPDLWKPTRTLVYDDLGEDDFFGTALAIDDEHLVVGAPADRASLPRGMSYAFGRNQGGADAWGQVARLNQHHRHNLEFVGQYLALDGDTAILGSHGHFWEEGLAPDLSDFGVFGGLVEGWASAALWLVSWVPGISGETAEGGNTYIYSRDAGGQSHPWTYLRRIELWDEVEVVALAGNQFVIGMPSRNEVRIHARNAGGKDRWGWIKTVLPPQPTSDRGFGGSVAFDGETLVVGPFAPWNEPVRTYRRNVGGPDAWGFVAELRVPPPYQPNGFGASLALDGERLAVGAPLEDDAAGAVYLFQDNPGGEHPWTFLRRIVPPDPLPGRGFGMQIAFDRNLLAVGAPGADQRPGPSAGSILHEFGAGSAYVFARARNRPPTLDPPQPLPAFTLDEDTPPGWIHGLRVDTLLDRARVADEDGDRCGIRIDSIPPLQGTWQFSIDGGAWTNLATQPPGLYRVLAPETNLRFVPDTNFHGLVSTALVYRAWDRTRFEPGEMGAVATGDDSPFSAATAALGLHVRPVNDRPSLQRTGNPVLPTLYANILSPHNRGQLVSNLLAGIATDADGDALGLGVTRYLTGHGAWEYSPDDGTSWRAFGSIPDGTAWPLRPVDRIRFVPKPNYSGTVEGGLTFVAWDQTTAASGNPTSLNTGSTFSLETTALVVTVTPEVNHAPILDLFGEPALPRIPFNATFGEGARVSDLLGSWVEDLDGDVCGLALAQTDTTHGTWQFSLDDGLSWQPIGAVSFDDALLLGPDARIRFLPATGYSGVLQVAILYRAWDRTAGTEGARINAQIAGGETSLSVGIEPVPLTVLAASNRAPTLTSPTQLFLPQVRENDPDPTGEFVGNLIQSVATDPEGTPCGIAVYALTVNFGTWEYSLDLGTTWLPASPVSTSAARLLPPSARLRMIPAPGFQGTVTQGLEFRAWDRSSGRPGGTASLIPFGGGTAFSGRTGTLGITVAPLNHPPRLLNPGPLPLTAITEGQTNNPGDLVSNLLHRATADADGDVCGLAVVAIPQAPGTWEYSLDERRTWLRLVLSRTRAALLLGPSSAVRFVPDPGFSGTVTNGFRFLAWDQSAGTPGGSIPSLRFYSQSAFGSSTGSVSIAVQPANRPPTTLALEPADILEGRPTRSVVGELSAHDPNPGDRHTFSLVPGPGDDDNTAFVITENRLLSTVVFDHEHRDRYRIRVQARDSEGASLAQPLEIRILDVDDSSPTAIRLSPASITENLPAGATVGRLAADDPDLVSSHSFTLVADPGVNGTGRFAILPPDTLVTTTPLDYETTPRLALRIQADDGRNPPLTQTLHITVLDLDDNEPPHELTLDPTTLPDAAPAGTAVGWIAAFDRNPGDRHTYRLATGAGDHDNAAFRIAGNLLTTSESIGFANLSSRRVRIEADDGRGGTIQRTFEILPATPLWHDDFEAGPGPWTEIAEVGPKRWEITPDPIGSPSHTLTATADTGLSDASAVSGPIELPHGLTQLRLEFRHLRDWGPAAPEPLDGGVLEWRFPDQPWEDLLLGEVARRVVIGGYGPVLLPAVEHPLAGRRAWVGNSTNRFTPVVASLDAPRLAGRTVQFRWRQATASGIAGRRWAIDDVRLSGTGATLDPPDPESFRILTSTLNDGRLVLTWETQPARSYSLEARAVANSGTWTSVLTALTGQPEATITTTTFDLRLLPGYPHHEYYFRIRSP